MSDYPVKTYTQFEEALKSLIGVSSLSDDDRNALREYANRRFRIAYEKYPWPQFTIVGELILLLSKSFFSYTKGGTNKLNYNADVVFKIHKQNPREYSYTDEYLFLQDEDAFGNTRITLITDETIGSPGGKNVYITYRRHLDDLINEVVGVTSGMIGHLSTDGKTIPWMLFPYIVYGSYVDFLKSDGQTSKALAEEQNAGQILLAEIDKISNQGRQFRHDVLQYRPNSQFKRHNVQIGGNPVVTDPATNVQ